MVSISKNIGIIFCCLLYLLIHTMCAYSREIQSKSGHTTFVYQHDENVDNHVDSLQKNDYSCSHTWHQTQSMLTVPNPIYFEQQSFDVLHYDVSMTFLNLPTTQTQTITTIRVRWISQPDSFRFHLRINGQFAVESSRTISNFTRVESTTIGTVSDNFHHFTVPAPQGTQIGDTTYYRVLYSGEMFAEQATNSAQSFGGVHRDGSGIYAIGVGFTNSYVSTTCHWLACYDHPSDKATFSGHFTVLDSTYKVASNGTLDSVTITGVARTFHWSMRDPSSTYLLTFAANKFQVIRSNIQGQLKRIPTELYSLPSDSANTIRSFSGLQRMVSAFEKRFGRDYPFEKIGYVNTQKGAMEHQTMISYPTFLAQSRDTINSVGAHELAHQWFGDLVSPMDFRDAWLTESFATYSESLWLEELIGFPTYLTNMNKQINNYMFQYAKIGNPSYEGIFPIYNFSRTAPSSNYPRTIYEKGAGVLGMLRYMMRYCITADSTKPAIANRGDSLFTVLLSTYLQKYAYGNATTSNFKAHLIDVVPFNKRNVADFFDQWIIGKGFPTFEITSTRTRIGDSYSADVQIKQTQDDSLGIYTWMPLELTFRNSQNNRVHKTVVVTGNTTSIRIDSVNDFVAIMVNAGVEVRSFVVLKSTPVVVSVTDNSQGESSLLVYPNPSQENFTIKLPDGIKSSSYTYEIQSIHGLTLKRHTIESALCTFSSNDLANGTYSCSVYDSHNSLMYSTLFTVHK